MMTTSRSSITTKMETKIMDRQTDKASYKVSIHYNFIIKKIVKTFNSYKYFYVFCIQTDRLPVKVFIDYMYPDQKNLHENNQTSILNSSQEFSVSPILFLTNRHFGIIPCFACQSLKTPLSFFHE